MSLRATHKSPAICLGCLRDHDAPRPRHSGSRHRSGTSSFCSTCRIQAGEQRLATAGVPMQAQSNDVAALALISALGFWLDA